MNVKRVNGMTKAAMVLAAVEMASLASAGEVKSGLRPGDFVGSFDVVKCAGAVNDGIAVGSELCYCCELGVQPVVMVFAYQPDQPALTNLIKRIEKTVAQHKAQKLAGLVSLLGPDRDALIGQAKELGSKHKLEHTALVVPNEHAKGPEGFELNTAAEVTVMIYNEAQVVATYAFGPGGLDAKAVDKIIADTGKMVAK